MKLSGRRKTGRPKRFLGVVKEATQLVGVAEKNAEDRKIETCDLLW